MERRVFFIEAGKAFPVVLGALYLIRCGSSFNPPPLVDDVVGVSTVVNAHIHRAYVPASDQLDPTGKTYTSSTDSGHSHLVTLSVDQLKTIASSGSVTVTSTASQVTGSHQHDFRFQRFLGV
jgi:hypothetical protein